MESGNWMSTMKIAKKGDDFINRQSSPGGKETTYKQIN